MPGQLGGRSVLVGLLDGGLAPEEVHLGTRREEALVLLPLQALPEQREQA